MAIGYESTSNFLISNATTGFVYKANYGTDDAGSNIAVEFETGQMDLDDTPRVKIVRWYEFIADADAGTPAINIRLVYNDGAITYTNATAIAASGFTKIEGSVPIDDGGGNYYRGNYIGVKFDGNLDPGFMIRELSIRPVVTR
jgi:hypothetical protein